MLTVTILFIVIPGTVNAAGIKGHCQEWYDLSDTGSTLQCTPGAPRGCNYCYHLLGTETLTFL